ncbi:DUF2567 domain-containing protein [Micromonospora narathiwatensis]|uniref:DUF2567 domain-containing protein n=1 Tax=Micromonospora narathiwatensis TaxID=299146 RepID=A0A1A8ZVL7_9ACTN|nr:DUF2567 domain-containing protein [Micromonospora narathiwatensis]SBT48164.1 Protein of unknown function (DUF2567) [Micromonospora narathiwatensis]
MSPDTPDPERDADRPGPADRLSGGPAGGYRPASGPDHPATDGSPATGDLPGWPAGLPAPAGTPVPAPGADPLAGHPGLDPLAGPPGVVWAAPGEPSTAAGRGRPLWITLGVALVLTGLGAPLGLLWAAVAPGTPVRKTAEGAIYATSQPEQPIAADGWFSLLGLGFGVLAAIALWFLLRRRRGPVGLLAGALGGLGAALVAWQLGRRVGLGTYHRLLETAPDGAAFTKPADLRAGGVDWYLHVLPVPYGNLLLPAFGVAVAYTLLAGWSRWPSLRPEPDDDGGWPPVGPELSSASEDPPAR